MEALLLELKYLIRKFNSAEFCTAKIQPSIF